MIIRPSSSVWITKKETTTELNHHHLGDLDDWMSPDRQLTDQLNRMNLRLENFKFNRFRSKKEKCLRARTYFKKILLPKYVPRTSMTFRLKYTHWNSQSCGCRVKSTNLVGNRNWLLLRHSWKLQRHSERNWATRKVSCLVFKISAERQRQHLKLLAFYSGFFDGITRSFNQ